MTKTPRFQKEEGEIEPHGISGYENENGVVEIHDFGNGIFRIQPTTFREDGNDDIAEQITAALSWWRGKTNAKIISTSGFQGEENYCGPSLIVVTETDKN
tara:strand:- start:248 stop:547 length:300 start_codon:yes stop_codon:yes gene_type:complete